MNANLIQIENNWSELNKVVHPPKNNKELKKLSNLLDDLLDEIGDASKHELWGLVDLISNYIEEYENKHIPLPKVTGVEMLKFLMVTNNLRQIDLQNELGSQGVVSEILNGKRELNLEHIKKLAKRFNVSADTFIDFNSKKSSK